MFVSKNIFVKVLEKINFYEQIVPPPPFTIGGLAIKWDFEKGKWLPLGEVDHANFKLQHENEILWN